MVTQRTRPKRQEEILREQRRGASNVRYLRSQGRKAQAQDLRRIGKEVEQELEKAYTREELTNLYNQLDPQLKKVVKNPSQFQTGKERDLENLNRSIGLLDAKIKRREERLGDTRGERRDKLKTDIKVYERERRVLDEYKKKIEKGERYDVKQVKGLAREEAYQYEKEREARDRREAQIDKRIKEKGARYSRDTLKIGGTVVTGLIDLRTGKFIPDGRKSNVEKFQNIKSAFGTDKAREIKDIAKQPQVKAELDRLKGEAREAQLKQLKQSRKLKQEQTAKKIVSDIVRERDRINLNLYRTNVRIENKKKLLDTIDKKENINWISPPSKLNDWGSKLGIRGFADRLNQARKNAEAGSPQRVSTAVGQIPIELSLIAVNTVQDVANLGVALIKATDPKYSARKLKEAYEKGLPSKEQVSAFVAQSIETVKQTEKDNPARLIANLLALRGISVKAPKFTVPTSETVRRVGENLRKITQTENRKVEQEIKQLEDTAKTLENAGINPNQRTRQGRELRELKEKVRNLREIQAIGKAKLEDIDNIIRKSARFPKRERKVATTQTKKAYDDVVKSSIQAYKKSQKQKNKFKPKQLSEVEKANLVRLASEIKKKNLEVIKPISAPELKTLLSKRLPSEKDLKQLYFTNSTQFKRERRRIEDQGKKVLIRPAKTNILNLKNGKIVRDIKLKIVDKKAPKGQEKKVEKEKRRRSKTLSVPERTKKEKQENLVKEINRATEQGVKFVELDKPISQKILNSIEKRENLEPSKVSKSELAKNKKAQQKISFAVRKKFSKLKDVQKGISKKYNKFKQDNKKYGMNAQKLSKEKTLTKKQQQQLKQEQKKLRKQKQDLKKDVTNLNKKIDINRKNTLRLRALGILLLPSQKQLSGLLNDQNMLIENINKTPIPKEDGKAPPKNKQITVRKAPTPKPTKQQEGRRLRRAPRLPTRKPIIRRGRTARVRLPTPSDKTGPPKLKKGERYTYKIVFGRTGSGKVAQLKTKLPKNQALKKAYREISSGRYPLGRSFQLVVAGKTKKKDSKAPQEVIRRIRTKKSQDPKVKSFVEKEKYILETRQEKDALKRKKRKR